MPDLREDNGQSRQHLQDGRFEGETRDLFAHSGEFLSEIRVSVEYFRST